MPSKPISKNPSLAQPEVSPPETELGQAGSPEATDLPGKLTQFIKRLASFGLGETPDLLTEARRPAKRPSGS